MKGKYKKDQMVRSVMARCYVMARCDAMQEKDGTGSITLSRNIDTPSTNSSTPSPDPDSRLAAGRGRCRIERRSCRSSRLPRRCRIVGTTRWRRGKVVRLMRPRPRLPGLGLMSLELRVVQELRFRYQLEQGRRWDLAAKLRLSLGQGQCWLGARELGFRCQLERGLR